MYMSYNVDIQLHVVISRLPTGTFVSLSSCVLYTCTLYCYTCTTCGNQQTTHWDICILIILCIIHMYIVLLHLYNDLICFLVFNATFSNISAISWRPVLVVEEAGVDHGQATGKLYHLAAGCESSAPFFVIYKAGCEPMWYW